MPKRKKYTIRATIKKKEKTKESQMIYDQIMDKYLNYLLDPNKNDNSK